MASHNALNDFFKSLSKTEKIGVMSITGATLISVLSSIVLCLPFSASYSSDFYTSLVFFSLGTLILAAIFLVFARKTIAIISWYASVNFLIVFFMALMTMIVFIPEDIITIATRL